MFFGHDISLNIQVYLTYKGPTDHDIYEQKQNILEFTLYDEKWEPVNFIIVLFFKKSHK